MPQVIKCPSCAAPLEYHGAAVEKCAFCGSRVIVSPNDVQTEQSFGFDALFGKAQKLKEVLNLARAGKKIAAIKLYRETFGVGLAEAKDAVERLERGDSVNFQHLNFQTLEVFKTGSENVLKIIKLVTGTIVLIIIVSAIASLTNFGKSIYSIFKPTKSSPSANSSSPTSNSQTSENPKSASEKVAYATETLRFGGDGTGAGFFKDNRSIAVDGAGRIYTGDYTGGRIQSFDKDGKFISQWMIDEEAALLDIAANRQGNVFVAQKGGILKFDGASGKLLEKFSPSGYIRDLTIFLDGKIAACDGQNIYLFDENLKQLAIWKDAAKTAGFKSGIARLAVNGLNEIYALDRDGKNVSKFSRDGTFVDRFKTKSDNGEDIAVDGKNRILVSDINDVYVYDADGNFLDSFETRQTFGIIFDAVGELLTASRPFVVKYQLKN